MVFPYLVPSHYQTIGAIEYINLLLLIAGVEPNPGPRGSTGDITYEDLDIVCDHIGADWKKLARHLFRESDVHFTDRNIFTSCDGRYTNTADKCHDMLLKWLCQYPNATRETLLQALNELQLVAIADKITGKKNKFRAYAALTVALRGGLGESPQNVRNDSTQSKQVSRLPRPTQTVNASSKMTKVSPRTGWK